LYSKQHRDLEGKAVTVPRALVTAALLSSSSLCWLSSSATSTFACIFCSPVIVSYLGDEGQTHNATVDIERQDLQKIGFCSVGGFTMASSGTVVVNMATLEGALDLKKKKSVQIGKLYRFPLVQPECMGEQSYF